MPGHSMTTAQRKTPPSPTLPRQLWYLLAMSRYIIAADISGRPSLDTLGSDRITAAAVVVRAEQAEEVRGRASALPKWRDADEAVAAYAIELLARDCVAVGVASMTKDSSSWPAFFAAAKPLQAAIVAQDRATAGFVKPANVAVYALLCYAYALATAHAIKVDRVSGLIERTVVCDTDIKGKENLEAFRNFWARSDQHQPRMNSLGITIVTKGVTVTTEEDEPLLRLADLAAGLAHCALIADPGRIKMPLEQNGAKRLLDQLQATGKLAILSKQFDVRYEEIFGEALQAAASERP